MEPMLIGCLLRSAGSLNDPLTTLELLKMQNRRLATMEAMENRLEEMEQFSDVSPYFSFSYLIKKSFKTSCISKKSFKYKEFDVLYKVFLCRNKIVEAYPIVAAKTK